MGLPNVPPVAAFLALLLAPFARRGGVERCSCELLGVLDLQSRSTSIINAGAHKATNIWENRIQHIGKMLAPLLDSVCKHMGYRLPSPTYLEIPPHAGKTSQYVKKFPNVLGNPNLFGDRWRQGRNPYAKKQNFPTCWKNNEHLQSYDLLLGVLDLPACGDDQRPHGVLGPLEQLHRALRGHGAPVRLQHMEGAPSEKTLHLVSQTSVSKNVPYCRKNKFAKWTTFLAAQHLRYRLKGIHIMRWRPPSATTDVGPKTTSTA